LTDKSSWTIDNWLAYIESIHTSTIEMGLERARQVLNNLNFKLPAKSRVITIAGTNGKGTTLALLEQLGLDHGLNVGAYTSPHIFHFTERLRINGQKLVAESWVAAFKKVDYARQVHDVAIALTYYEFTTLAALQLVAENNIDLIVLEVGLGGRLDTVNIIDPDIAVITSIALDHQAYLGNTLELIAAEKCGIARANKPLFFGGQLTPKIIVSQAKKLSIELFDASSRAITRQDTQTKSWSLKAKCQPQHKAFKLELNDLPKTHIPHANALLGLHVWLYFWSKFAEIFDKKADFSIYKIRQAIHQTHVFGRMTEIFQHPSIYIDAAHNPAAAELLAVNLKALPPVTKTIAIFAAMSDKDIKGIIKPLMAIIDQWIFCPLPGDRAASQARLTQVFDALVEEHQLSVDVSARISMPWQELPFNDQHLSVSQDESSIRYIIFGSFFTIEALLLAWPKFDRPYNELGL